MKKVLLCFTLVTLCMQGIAQQLPKQVIAEHFTNTYCSICASKNPGLFANLQQFPSVLHVAYYPSSPYASCPLSQYNVTEADARTNFYGIYGATPRLAVGGDIISSIFTDTNIFASRLPQMSSFRVAATIDRTTADSATVRYVIEKRDTSSLSSATLYGIITEDTLLFTASNGETRHYDVFRKAIWGATPLPITLPAIVGDSVVFTKTIAWDNVWQQKRVSTTAIVQDDNKKVIQAARSARLPEAANINTVNLVSASVYPTPASDMLYINCGAQVACTLYNSCGLATQLGELPGAGSFNISWLPAGIYILNLRNGSVNINLPVIKN